jgi:Cu/Ag efflux pump CusA
LGKTPTGAVKPSDTRVAGFTVVIGGLITSTFLTLLVLPIVYHWMEKPKKMVEQEE